MTVDSPPTRRLILLTRCSHPIGPPVPSPAVCLFIFYVCVGVQVCLHPRERRSSALTGPLLLGPVGPVGASHHIAVYVACVFDCTFTHRSGASGLCDVSSRRRVCLGVLRDARSRSNRLRCPQSVILFPEPSARGLFSLSFLCVCLAISLRSTLYFSPISSSFPEYLL